MALERFAVAEGSFFVGLESTFGTTPSMTRCTPIADTVEVIPTQNEIPVDNLRVDGWDVDANVHGTKGGTVKFGYYEKPVTSILNAAATPAVSPLARVKAGAFGGDTSVAGSLIEGTSIATQIDVSAGEGGRFPQATIGFAEVGGTVEPFYVSTRATDALTPWPSLSAVPTSGGVVHNSYGVHPLLSNGNSTSFQWAYAADADHQWTANGCRADTVELKTDAQGLIRWDFGYEMATWTGPVAQAVSVAAGGDAMGDAFAVKDNLCYLQTVATLTRVTVPVRSFSMKFAPGMTFTQTLGGIEGKGAVKRTQTGRAVTVSLRLDGSDLAYDALWAAKTQLRLMFMIPQGSLLTKRWFVVMLPYCFIAKKPVSMRDQGILVTDLELQPQINSALSSTHAKSPVLIATG